MVADLEQSSIDARKKIYKPGLIVELVGPAAAGKSTLATAMLQRDRGIQPGSAPYFRNPRHIPFFARNTLPLLSCLVSSLWARNGRRLTGREFVWMATLNGWHYELVQQAASPNAIVLLDQGPVFLLTELYVFGPKSLRGRSAMKWWQTAFQDWANTLDLIIWLDAADRILIERIQARSKWHVMKGKQEEEIIQFLGEYRQAYEDVISMLLLNSAHLEILRLDTSLETIETLVDRLLFNLESRAGFYPADPSGRKPDLPTAVR